MAFARIKCPSCDMSFGQEKRFLEHYLTVHGIVADENLYNESRCQSPPICACGCGKPLKWNGWKKGYTSKYLRGHNAVDDSVFAKPDRMKEFVAKRVVGYAEGRYEAWNKGQTKETNDKLAKASQKISTTLQEGYESGRLVSWQTGLTKETDQRLAKSSQTKKERYASGETQPWNLGLSKKSSQQVANIANKISNVEYEKRFNAQRFSQEEFLEIIKSYPQFELQSNQETYKNKYQKLKFRCTKCNALQIKNLMMLRNTPICFNCHPKESKGQLEVLDYVRSLGVEVVSNDREIIAPKELDIWVPEHRLGIEYNGLYWHSEEFLDKNYHNKKVQSARAAGVSFLMIYEDEWRDHSDIIRSMIRHRLGLSTVRKVGARQCIIKQVNTEQRRRFLNANHLEGDVNATTAFGLFESDELIACMSLRRPFHRKYSDYVEVARSACAPDISIPGWIGKLSKVCLQHTKTVFGKRGLISYVDSRIGSGKSYIAAGFKILVEDTGPRLFWTDYHKRFNRFTYKADKTNNLSQKDVCEVAGVVAIWGAANCLLVLN